jgi:hypothetical protein
MKLATETGMATASNREDGGRRVVESPRLMLGTKTKKGMVMVRV